MSQDRLCSTCCIGFILPSGVCDHCNSRAKKTRTDSSGRDVTNLPGLWDESDRIDDCCEPDNTPLHLVRMYAAQLKRVADMYAELETMAKQPGSNLGHVLAVAGSIATNGLSQAAKILLAMYPPEHK